MLAGISKRMDLPSAQDHFCRRPWPSDTSDPPLDWLTVTELLPVTAGWCGGIGDGGVCVSCILTPPWRPLARTPSAPSVAMDDRLNRSAKSACGIGTCSLVAPGEGWPRYRTFAPRGHRPDLEPGSSSRRSLVINCSSVKLPISTRAVDVYRHGSSPLNHRGVISSGQFDSATSNAGAAAVVCPGSEMAARTTPRQSRQKLLDIQIFSDTGDRVANHACKSLSSVETLESLLLPRGVRLRPPIDT